MPDESKDHDTELVRKALDQLGEHFDSVQIFATRHEPETEGGTIKIQNGTGNWFARYGQICEWVESENERSRCYIRKRERDREE